jgi:D-arabinose 1-dehydrogenase-like Zn-dependent alcohol dehydrogenase
MMGRIVELGEGVETDYAGQKVSLGDRIVPVYYLTCQKCPACLTGNFNICVHGSDFQGQNADKYPHFTGGFSTHYYIQPNQYFYKVPDSVPDNVAAGANCGIAQMVYALDMAALKVGDTLVIQGAGGVGLFATAIGKTMGITTVVIEGADSRIAEAKRFGADHIIDMKKFDTVPARLAEIERISGGRGADVVLEVAGVPKAFDEGIRLVRLGGTLVEVGNVLIDESQNTTVVPGLITRKCVTVKGILRYQPWYLHKTLQFLEKYHDKYPFAGLTDRTYSLEEVPLAIERAAAREVARAIIEPNKHHSSLKMRAEVPN